MHEVVAMLLGLLAWSVVFVPLFLVWWLPGRREKQALVVATRRRDERFRLRVSERAS